MERKELEEEIKNLQGKIKDLIDNVNDIYDLHFLLGFLEKKTNQ